MKRIGQYYHGAVAALAVALMSRAALADGVGDMTVSTAFEIQDFAGLISTVAYVAGGAFGIGSVMKLKQHADDPRGTPLKHGVMGLFGSAMLVSLPFVIDSMARTFGADGGGWPLLPPGLSSGGGLLGRMAGAMTTELTKTTFLLEVVCYIGAGVLGLAGIFKLKNHSESPHQTSLAHGFLRLFGAGLLIALPYVIESFIFTIGADGPGSLVAPTMGAR